MSTVLRVFGPFEISCQKSPKGPQKHIGQKHAKAFWNQQPSPYATKQGCYVFVLKAGRGYTPWYVGKTTKSFKQECFTTDKLGKYNASLFQQQQGRPMLFLVAPGGSKNKVPTKIVGDVEGFLTQQGRQENPRIMNKRNARLPEWGIKGVLRGGKGKPQRFETAFAKMMGLR
jgi:hypothetical protein